MPRRRVGKKRTRSAKRQGSGATVWQKPFLGLLMVILAGLAVLSLTQESQGWLSSGLRNFISLFFGDGVWLVAAATFLIGVSLLMPGANRFSARRRWGVFLTSLALLAGMGAWNASAGWLGNSTAWILEQTFGEWGQWWLILVGLLAGCLMLSNRNGMVFLDALLNLLKAAADTLKRLRLAAPSQQSAPEAKPMKGNAGEPVLSVAIPEPDPAPAPDISFPSGRSETVPSIHEAIQQEDDGEKKQESFEIQERRASPHYRLPPLDLLKNNNARRKAPHSKQEVQARSRQLEETLASFGVTAKVTHVDVGPAITRYELMPGPGVKVSRISQLADDIALSLAAADVRVVAPIPGKSAVGIEVPNDKVSPVYLYDVLAQTEFQRSTSPLTLALGEEITGRPIITRLDRMLHVLIAGATGSGKSVCINTLLCSLLFKADPDQVKLILIDPKMVELTNYNGIPHLLSPVVTDAKKAAGVLRWLCKEMENRYEQFAGFGVRDITRFNQMAIQNGKENLPYIVVVIDELADLMMVAPRDVEDAIQRLAQMARAAGIHLVVATQRPSVDVITGIIKANIPSRIAFAVSSQVDSRTILDMAGAEKLVGRGDMLFYPMGASKPIRAQGAYVSENELEKLLSYIRSMKEPEFNEEVMQAEVASATAEEPAEEDELFADAVRVVLEHGQASVSIVQRRLRVGYSRAGRLVDLMEERGIIGPHRGSKPREILVSQEQAQLLLLNRVNKEIEANPK